MSDKPLSENAALPRPLFCTCHTDTRANGHDPDCPAVHEMKCTCGCEPGCQHHPDCDVSRAERRAKCTCPPGTLELPDGTVLHDEQCALRKAERNHDYAIHKALLEARDLQAVRQCGLYHRYGFHLEYWPHRRLWWAEWTIPQVHGETLQGSGKTEKQANLMALRELRDHLELQCINWRGDSPFSDPDRRRGEE